MSLEFVICLCLVHLRSDRIESLLGSFCLLVHLFCEIQFSFFLDLITHQLGLSLLLKVKLGKSLLSFDSPLLKTVQQSELLYLKSFRKLLLHLSLLILELRLHLTAYLCQSLLALFLVFLDQSCRLGVLFFLDFKFLSLLGKLLLELLLEFGNRLLVFVLCFLFDISEPDLEVFHHPLFFVHLPFFILSGNYSKPLFVLLLGKST